MLHMLHMLNNWCLEEDLQAMNKWTEANKLTLNVQKTQLMVLARKRRETEADEVEIKLEGKKLERSNVVKCLGVLLDDKLKYTEHVKAVKRKACVGLAKLRMLQHSLPSNIKTKLYNAIVLPHLDYCSVLWMECAKSLRHELQRLQNYGMRLILNAPPRTSSEGLRERLGWTTLEMRREISRLTLVRRCIRKEAPNQLCKLFKTNRQIGNCRTRGKDNLIIPNVKSEIYRKSFTFQSSTRWNNLPNDLKDLQNTTTFKRMLNNINF